MRGPQDIVAGPDGALWFTANGRIGRITTSGSVTSYALPSGSSNRGQDITVGPDKNLWFAEEFGNRIGKVTTAGKVTEYTIPTVNSSPYGITAGIAGNLWFTESQASKLGKITTAGTITEQTINFAGNPRGIISGPDGNLWFAEGVQNQIGEAVIASSISGSVFDDLDHDGIKDSNEGALANIRIYLDKNDNGIDDAGETSVLSDSSGKWSFILPAGSYTVRARSFPAATSSRRP